MMSRLVMALGAAMILMGVTIGVFPEEFFSVLDWESGTGRSIAAVIRLVTGLIFILGASATRFPTGFRIFGGLVVLAGLIILFLPLELWAALMSWVIHDDLTLARLGAGLGGPLLGAFIVYAAWPERSDD